MSYRFYMADLIIAVLALIAALIFALFMVTGAALNMAAAPTTTTSFIQWTAFGLIVSVILAIYFFYRFYRYDEEDVTGSHSL